MAGDAKWAELAPLRDRGGERGCLERYQGHDLPLLDLIQEGILPLAQLREIREGARAVTSLDLPVEVGRLLGLARDSVLEIEAEALERLAIEREIQALREGRPSRRGNRCSLSATTP